MEAYRDFIIREAMVRDEKNRGTTWTHKDYDGEGDDRFGYSETVDQAKRDVDYWWQTNHFPSALDGLIDDFASDPGISDDELIEHLEAKASAIRANVRKLEGV